MIDVLPEAFDALGGHLKDEFSGKMRDFFQSAARALFYRTPAPGPGGPQPK